MSPTPPPVRTVSEIIDSAPWKKWTPLLLVFAKNRIACKSWGVAPPAPRDFMHEAVARVLDREPDKEVREEEEVLRRLFKLIALLVHNTSRRKPNLCETQWPRVDSDIDFPDDAPAQGEELQARELVELIVQRFESKESFNAIIRSLLENAQTISEVAESNGASPSAVFRAKQKLRVVTSEVMKPSWNQNRRQRRLEP